MESTEHIKPAEAFPVGEYLREELEARGWTGAEFAEILGRPAQLVSEILNNRKEITPETATEIAAATGTAAQTWLRLQDLYRLWKLENATSDAKLTAVQRRARMRDLAPVSELVQRGLIPPHDLDAQERAICRLLGLTAIDQTPHFAIAARRSDKQESLSAAQTAWIGFVKESARDLAAAAFDVQGIRNLAASLTRTLKEPAGLATLPALLAAVGVRLVHVAAFKNSKIDGAALFDERGPVIGVSGRISRFDSVVFTNQHEIAQICLGHVADGPAIDVDLGRDNSIAFEQEADRQACDWALPARPSLRRPVSRQKVLVEADRLGVHPAIVVGRLQHSGELPWNQLNGLVPRVRSQLENWDTQAA
jgi:HTH-type transcriptional regulator/antitoxin HigA